MQVCDLGTIDCGNTARVAVTFVDSTDKRCQCYDVVDHRNIVTRSWTSNIIHDATLVEQSGDCTRGLITGRIRVPDTPVPAGTYDAFTGQFSMAVTVISNSGDQSGAARLEGHLHTAGTSTPTAGFGNVFVVSGALRFILDSSVAQALVPTSATDINVIFAPQINGAGPSNSLFAVPAEPGVYVVALWGSNNCSGVGLDVLFDLIPTDCPLNFTNRTGDPGTEGWWLTRCQSC